MDNNTPDRMLLISSRLAPRYELSESDLKNLQHIFTAWLPRVVYYDLTDDTVHVQVEVKRGIITGKSVFNAAFLGADGSVIKSTTYDQDRMLGKVCPQYDQSRTKYQGKKDGFDQRVVYYVTSPASMNNASS